MNTHTPFPINRKSYLNYNFLFLIGCPNAQKYFEKKTKFINRNTNKIKEKTSFKDESLKADTGMMMMLHLRSVLKQETAMFFYKKNGGHI